jgi:hypothetical protein
MKFLAKPIALLLVSIVILSCKKEATLSEFKYSENDYPVTCDNADLDLIKEAVFSFEDDITAHFANKGTKNLSQAYSRTVNLALYGRAKYNEIVSPHTIEIFNILKGDKQLWKVDGATKTLNYNSEFIKCLGTNLSDKDLKTTFNALLTTNSMSSKLFGEPLRRKAYLAVRDKNLATYIALDMYYAKLFDLDLNQERTSQKATPAATNK